MVGTSGCFSGNAVVLKEKLPGVRCVAGEPAASPALSAAGPFTGHRIEGTGPGFAPANFRRDLADAVVAVSDADAHRDGAAAGPRGRHLRRDLVGRQRLDRAAAGAGLAERRAHRDRGLRFRPEVSPGRSLSVVSGPDPSTRWLSCHVRLRVPALRRVLPIRLAAAGGDRRRRGDRRGDRERPAADRRRRSRVAGRLDARAAGDGRHLSADRRRLRLPHAGVRSGRGGQRPAGAPAPSTPRSATPRCRRRASTFPGCA